MKGFKQFFRDPALVVVFISYCLLVAVTIGKHEPWADEAQSWLLARDSSFSDLVFNKLRYNGHPMLWYLILFLPSKFLSYNYLGIIPWTLSSFGIFVFLTYSPFPKIFKIIFPFTYFLFFQYSVIARSYVLLPVFLFLSAQVYKEKFSKIYLFTVLQILLAFTSIFSLIIAVSTMAIHTAELMVNRKKIKARVVRKNTLALLVFFTSAVLVMLQIWPPSDLQFAQGFNLNPIRLFAVGLKVLTATFSENIYLSLIFLIVSLYWFKLRKALGLFVIPVTSIIVFFSAKYYSVWHQGIIFLIWMLVYWVAIGNVPSRRDFKVETLVRRMMHFSLFIVLLIQIFWAFSSFFSDYLGPYSAGKAVANYIKQNKMQDKKIYAVSYWTVSVLPYFANNIFANYTPGENPSFWAWSLKKDPDSIYREIEDQKPDLVIVARPNTISNRLTGYSLVGVYEGSLYWKDGIKENNDIAIFRKEGVGAD